MCGWFLQNISSQELYRRLECNERDREMDIKIEVMSRLPSSISMNFEIFFVSNLDVILIDETFVWIV